MSDFRTRRAVAVAVESCGTPAGDGLADVETLQTRAARAADHDDEAAFYLETLAEYSWARDVAGLAPSTMQSLLNDAAPLWPSERLPTAIAALNLPVAPAIVPETFRRTLKQSSHRYLPGPVPELYPHLMRHACATHNYESGMPLWDVQKLLGHEWPSTTVGYLASAGSDPERTVLESTHRAVRRLGMEG